MLWETLTDPGVYNRTALDQGLPPLRLISYNSILRGWSWYGKRACYWHYPSDWSPATIATPWTDHQPVTGLTHRDRTPFALKFTPMCSLELPVNLTLLNACLYVRIFYIRTLYKILQIVIRSKLVPSSYTWPWVMQLKLEGLGYLLWLKRLTPLCKNKTKRRSWHGMKKAHWNFLRRLSSFPVHPSPSSTVKNGKTGNTALWDQTFRGMMRPSFGNVF